jgi:hypothetical protein
VKLYGRNILRNFYKKYTFGPTPLFLPFIPVDVNRIAAYTGFMVMKAL